MSFLTTDELKSVIYEYQLNQITEEDSDISVMAIDAAIEEIKSYLAPGGQKRYQDGRKRYDVDAIFAAEDEERNALILAITKSIALYRICELANVDIIDEKVTRRYDRAVDWLEKVSATGKYAGQQPLNAPLPVLADPDPDEDESLPFRSGSREKFNHE